MTANKSLVTGFPGFIASRLVARLLADDPKIVVAAVVEARMLDIAKERATEIGADRIEFLVGDITEPNFGLDESKVAELLTSVTSVFHLAAVYDLAVPVEVGQRVNVEGTGHVLDFCERCKNLKRLNYVSTAYVAGDRTGMVYEHELVAGQGFKNYYESTKYQAEMWVRDRIDRIPTTIYRPAIVVGDSKTGETQKFDGPYFILDYIAAADKRLPRVVGIGDRSAAFNVVPVDFVIDAMAVAASDDSFIGETLHLVDPEPVTAAELMKMLTLELTGKPAVGHMPEAISTAMMRIPPIHKLLGGAPLESLIYLRHHVQFDTRRSKHLLADAGLGIPRFADYVGPMVDFYRRNQGDPLLQRNVS